MRYYTERIYPYAISVIATFMLYRFGINYISSKNINEALDGMLTTSSLIIGFIGAVLPVIMSMKNDSKFVKYVFEEDKKQLFLKYMKENILFGILLIGISVSMYFKDGFEKTWYYNHVFYFWILLCISFLLCTFRCVNNMLNLIFSKDKELKKDSKPKVTERECRFIEKLDKKE